MNRRGASRMISLLSPARSSRLWCIVGTAVNQVEGVEHVVVTAGTGVPTSGLILGAG